MNKQKIYNSHEVQIGIVASIICILFLFISCQIGLGAQVDTEAPSVSVTYPPANAVIRSTFTLAGACSDDKGLASVTVTIKSTDTSVQTTYGSYAAVINSAATGWTLSCNNYDSSNAEYYNGWELPDGKYTAEVTALDTSGRTSSTNASLSFSIDNTAPVLVITKPTSVGSGTPKAFGRTVQLEGAFAEETDSVLANLTVSLYKPTGEKLFDSTFTLITDMSAANPLVFAQYYDYADTPTDQTSIEYKKWQNYKVLYGLNDTDDDDTRNKGVAEQYYFSVTASDKAALYTDPSNVSGTGSGNTTTTFYRGTSDMLNLINGKDEGYSGFSVLAIEKYLNGTDKTYAADTTLASYLSAAASKSVVSSDTVTGINADNTWLTFSINSKNNPTYNISGFAIDETQAASSDTSDDNGYVYYYTGSAINVSITSGLDGDNINTSTVTLYYQQKGGSTAKVFWTWNKAVALAEVKALDNTLTDAAAEVLLLANPSSYNYTPTSETENTDSLVKSISISSSAISPGKEYVFSVDGKDINKQSIVASSTTGYGFCAKTNVSVPQITFVTPTDLAVVKQSQYEEGIKVSGTVVSPDTPISLSYEIKVKNSSEQTTYTSSGTSDDTATDYDSTISMEPTNETMQFTWNFTAKKQSDVLAKLNSLKGLYVVTITVSVTNGGGKSSSSRISYLDNKAPAITNLSLSNSVKGTNVLYVNNSSGNTFSVSGTSSDNYSIKSTSVTITGKNASNETWYLQKSFTDLTWSYDDIDLSGFVPQVDAADLSVTVVATDSASGKTTETGNDTTETLSVEFDTAAPFLTTDETTYVYTIGGLSQSADNWYKDTALSVLSYFKDVGCGIASVYYQVLPIASAETRITSTNYNLSTLVGVGSIGLASVSDTSVKKTAATISGFAAGQNTLTFVAVDTLGNAKETDSYVVNVDQTEPEFASLYYTFDNATYGEAGGTVVANGKKDITIYGTVSDGASGVGGVTFTVDGTAVTPSSIMYTTATALDTEAKVTSASYSAYAAENKNTITGWKVVIPQKYIKEGVVKASAKDLAGNGDFRQIFTFTIDNESPKVTVAASASSLLSALSTIKDGVETITAPATGTIASLNKTATFSGTATDNYTLNDISLYYSLDDASASVTTTGKTNTLVGTLSGTSAYSWTFSKTVTAGNTLLSGNAYSDTNKTETAYFKEVATDSAGNASIYVYTYTIDPNKDRPEITLSNIAVSGTLLKSKTVYGTIADDDGSVEGLWYTTDHSLAAHAATDAATYAPTTTNAHNWNVITVLNGSWSCDSTAADGETTWYFYVIDAAGTSFCTKADSLLFRPYISDSTTADQDNTVGVMFQVDTTAPEIESMKLSKAATGTTTDAATYSALETTEWSTANNTPFGGTYGMLYVQIGVYEQTGMSSTTPVTLNLGDASCALISTDSGKYTYVVGPIDVTKKQSGTYVYKNGVTSLSVTVKDKAGTTNVKSMNIVIDNEAPTVTVTYPGTAVSDANTSTVTMKGIVEDNTSGSGLASFAYRIPKNSDDVETWNSLNTSPSWEIPFVSTETGNIMNILTYANNTYGTKYGFDGIWKVPVYFKMVDALGNASIDTSHYIVVDADGGKPTAQIIYPSLTAAGENPTAGGTINVYGTATDDVAVASVRVQLDVN
jgi:hypothetical protein